MERIPSTPPHIEPLPENIHRPLWSVMIPAYNCSHYLEKTISSVLQQDPGPEMMQIEVVDDHSTDADVGALVEMVGKGRVQYFRKEKNMGSLRNFETCINRAQGHLVHILHGDDFVLDGFYKEIEQLFNNYPHIGAAFTDFYFINSKGAKIYTDEKIADKAAILENWLYYIAWKQRIQPPAMVVKRSVYEKLGGFYAVKYGEDWEMWCRITANFEVAHSPLYLACYRVHDNNITSHSLISGQNIKDIKMVINIIQDYLPADKKKKIKKQAKRNFSIYYAWMAHWLYHEHKNNKSAIVQMRGALDMDLNKTTLYSALKLFTKLLIRYKYKDKFLTQKSK